MKFLAQIKLAKEEKAVIDKYESKFVPKSIIQNKYNVNERHFAEFQKRYLLEKKKLELKVIRDNQR